MASKILAAILFMSKLFPNFWSNDIWHYDFSWNKVVGYVLTVRDPQMVRDQKKFGNHWLNAKKKLLTTCQRWAWTGSGLDILQATYDLSDQDWIWIFIFEKKGSGYWFDLYNEIFLRVIQDVTNDGGSVFFAMVFILSICAALITTNGDSCYLSLNFSGQLEVVNCSYIAGMLLCLLCWMAYVCVV